MTKSFLYISILGLLVSCSNGDKIADVISDTSATANSGETISTQSKASVKEVKTSSGKTVVVSESHPKGQSLSDISVSFLNDSTTKLSLTDKDPVGEILTGDLDKNGFDEVYIITITAGSGSYGTVHGFASNNDKSFSMIYFPETSENDLKDGPMKGYAGHDVFKIEGQKLTRTFAVSTDKKETKTVAYQLKKTETGYALSDIK